MLLSSIRQRRGNCEWRSRQVSVTQIKLQVLRKCELEKEKAKCFYSVFVVCETRYESAANGLNAIEIPEVAAAGFRVRVGTCA